MKNKIIVEGRLITVRDSSKGKKIITVFFKSQKDSYAMLECDEEKIPANLKRHARIRVEGHIESKSSKSSSRIHNVYVVDEIKPSVTLCDTAFGIKGRFFEELNAKIYVAGTIDKVEDGKDWIRIFVKTTDPDGKEYTVRESLKRGDRTPRFNVGQEIYTVCCLNTQTKEMNGRNIYFSDIMIVDYAV